MKKTIKKAQVGTTKKATPVQYRDEMGKPRTAKEQRQWEKDELNMIDYKGRPADSYPGRKKDNPIQKLPYYPSKTKGDALKKMPYKPGDVKKGDALKKLVKGKKGIKVAKKGASFPDLNKDGKITKADILKGRGVIAKKGKKVMKGGGKCKYGCK